MRYGDILHEESDYMAMYGIDDPNMPDYPSWYADRDPDRNTPYDNYIDYYIELVQAQGYLDSQDDRRRRREGRMSFDPDDMVDNQIDDLLLERAIRKEASEDEENMIADMIENQVDAMIEERQGRAALRDLDLDADSPERFFRDGEYRPSAEEFDRRSERQQIRNNMEFVENAMRGLENVQESGSFGEDTDPDIVQWLDSTFELFDDDGSLDQTLIVLYKKGLRG